MVNNEFDMINNDTDKADSGDYIDLVGKTGNEESEEPFNWIKETFTWIKILVIAFSFASFINYFIILNADIPSGSMENTIMTHSRVLGNRISYEIGDPKRGDIVIFEYPDNPSELYIKRVIGLPGEKVTIKGDKIYINDSETPLVEDYVKEPWGEAGELVYEVPDGCYFMLGDNRNNSKDSRRWVNKFVERKAIKAKAMCVYWPYEHVNILGGHKYDNE